MHHRTTAALPDDADFERARFASADYAPRERLTALRDVYGRMLQIVEIEPLPGERLAADAVLVRMPGLSMITGRRSAATYRRRREALDHDDVGITFGLTGGCEARQLGRTLALGCGDAIVMTVSEPASITVPKLGEYVSLRVPVAALAHRVAGLEAAYGRAIPADDPALRLFVRYLRLLQETDAFAVPELRCQAIGHLHDLMALAIGATREAADAARCGARAACLRVLKQDIAANRSDLSLTALAARHRLTPRYIQRLFEAEGTTFTDYLLEQRLAAARRRLANPRAAGKISTIAWDCGFGDLSYFNRAFRRRYGATPSEVRKAARSG